MEVLGIKARPLLSDWNAALVNEDERVHRRVWDLRERQCFEDIEAHYRADPGVLAKDDLPLPGLDLRGHGVLLLSLS